MRDRTHWAGCLAGIATDANLGVDQVLLYEFGGGGHSFVSCVLSVGFWFGCLIVGFLVCLFAEPAAGRE